MAMRELPIAGGNRIERLGRPSACFDDDARVAIAVGDVELVDGTIEVDLALTGERAFPGLTWRMNGDNYESFFVRPHQSGNPDAVQYTPVFNGVSAWQLYHGSGFWNEVNIPSERWFTLRVAFAGDRGEAYVENMEEPALVFSRLRMPAVGGSIGLQPGGRGVSFARFAYDATAPKLRGASPPVQEPEPGVIPGWMVSNIVHEGVPPAAARTWTYLESEPNGLANLSRVRPLGTTLNTVFAATTLVARAAGTRALEIGFSDRAVVYLNGQPVFAGRDDYRSRDYRFLGSIGYWDTLFVPLVEGDNELVVAVSESFGGWGVMARLLDPSGIIFRR
ncbi:MAG TPA: hypothetical protein VH371_07495 [Candidatus Limnocylindrales bacterium]|jgi:hypothetical protein